MGVSTERRKAVRKPRPKSAGSTAQSANHRRSSRWLTSPPPYPIRRFTVAEYEKIARAGILTEDDNVELLEGWIVPKMTKHPPHDGTIDLIVYLFHQILPREWFPRGQNVVVTSDSEPEPDIAVVRGRPGDYRDRHPKGADVGLIIEVADSTVRRDRRKASIYAQAKVPVYWIVNLDESQIEIYSSPAKKGKQIVYQSRQILIRRDEVLMLVLDDKTVGKLHVSDILGPKTNTNGK